MQELPRIQTNPRPVPPPAPMQQAQQKSDPLRMAAGWIALGIVGICGLLFLLQTFVHFRAMFFRGAPMWLWLAYFASIMVIAVVAIGSLMLASMLLRWRR